MYPEPPLRIDADSETPLTNPVDPYPVEVGCVTTPIAPPSETALTTISPLSKL